jgi:hypothetical protein
MCEKCSYTRQWERLKGSVHCYARSQNAKHDYYLRHVCLSVSPFVLPSVRPPIRMEQLGSHRRNFHKI